MLILAIVVLKAFDIDTTHVVSFLVVSCFKIISITHLRNEQQHVMARDYEEFAYSIVVKQPFHAFPETPEVAKENLNVLSTRLIIFLKIKVDK